MMTRLLSISVGLALVLTACGPDDDDLLFDGKFFRTKVKSERGSRQQFIVTARPVSQSLEGAREASRHAAISYCIERYGSSDIAWLVGPDSEDADLPISDDTLTLQGTCPE